MQIHTIFSHTCTHHQTDIRWGHFATCLGFPGKHLQHSCPTSLLGQLWLQLSLWVCIKAHSTILHAFEPVKPLLDFQIGSPYSGASAPWGAWVLLGLPWWLIPDSPLAIGFLPTDTPSGKHLCSGEAWEFMVHICPLGSLHSNNTILMILKPAQVPCTGFQMLWTVCKAHSCHLRSQLGWHRGSCQPHKASPSPSWHNFVFACSGWHRGGRECQEGRAEAGMLLWGAGVGQNRKRIRSRRWVGLPQQILTPASVPTGIRQITWICTHTIAGTDLSSSIGVAGIWHGVRKKISSYSELHSSYLVIDTAQASWLDCSSAS